MVNEEVSLPVKWRKLFGQALRENDWDTVNSIFCSFDEERLNEVLCVSAVGLWFLKTKEQIDVLERGISKLIERGATAIDEALDANLTAITFLSTFMCIRGICSGVTIISTLKETAKWVNQRQTDSGGYPIFSKYANAISYMINVILSGLETYIHRDEYRDFFVQMPTHHQIVGFTNFLTTAAKHLPGKQFRYALADMCTFFGIFSDSLNPGWSSEISGTAIPIVLGLMAHMIANGGAFNTLFITASEMGHTELVDILLQVIHPMFQLDRDYGMLVACNEGHPDIVERLLEDGVTTFGHIPLKEAAQNGHLEIVEMLINKGCKWEEVYEALQVALLSRQAK